MKLYSETIAQQAIEDITNIIGNAHITIEYEIQDYGEFLLLRVKFLEAPSRVNIEIWHQELKKHFSKLFPNPVKGYTWMITLEHRETMLDSIMDELRLS